MEHYNKDKMRAPSYTISFLKPLKFSSLNFVALLKYQVERTVL